jgi:hypothetical protein
MPTVSQVGADNVYQMDSGEAIMGHFDGSTPAGWAMRWWFISIAIIVFMYLSL